MNPPPALFSQNGSTNPVGALRDELVCQVGFLADEVAHPFRFDSAYVKYRPHRRTKLAVRTESHMSSKEDYPEAHSIF
ncbi:hypothetical protein [Arcanobacterium haemolyticum]|uniref:hypothetical protein n=1 Tax=Arcanobacterium haemolyticum TaxID=28264 RepID=UPI001C656461|nr:hypothetical protein [Arcanobacterium haemolyticum]